jgi:hypothetical protein
MTRILLQIFSRKKNIIFYYQREQTAKSEGHMTGGQSLDKED